jgi:transposase
MKVLVHDGIGFWLAARRLHQGHFVWPTPDSQAPRVRQFRASEFTHPQWNQSLSGVI